METIILKTDTEINTNDSIKKSVNELQSGEIIALPTETVYGLCADALNSEAVEKIFSVKKRPNFNPLIVHIPNKSFINQIADIKKEEEKLISQLIETFWPGPLTIILKKKNIISNIVSGGLDTVAVRQSSNPIFSRIIKSFNSPIAAPSANIFGKLSPTCAQAVKDQLNNKIPFILDGGGCSNGLESTIIKIEIINKKNFIHILRPGPITDLDLKKYGKVVFLKNNSAIESPGMLESHYAPNKPLRFLKSQNEFIENKEKKYGLLSYRGKPKDGFINLINWNKIEILSPGSGRIAEAGTRLFHSLRELDLSDVDEIICEPIPNRSVGIAIIDKLRKASFKSS